MIDTWLSAALVLGVLALAVALRSIHGRLPEDRLVGGTIAITLGAMTSLPLSIAFGTLMILDLGLGIALIAFAAMIWSGRPGADGT